MIWFFTKENCDVSLLQLAGYTMMEWSAIHTPHGKWRYVYVYKYNTAYSTLTKEGGWCYGALYTLSYAYVPSISSAHWYVHTLWSTCSYWTPSTELNSRLEFWKLWRSAAMCMHLHRNTVTGCQSRRSAHWSSTGHMLVHHWRTIEMEGSSKANIPVVQHVRTSCVWCCLWHQFCYVDSSHSLSLPTLHHFKALFDDVLELQDSTRLLAAKTSLDSLRSSLSEHPNEVLSEKLLEHSARLELLITREAESREVLSMGTVDDSWSDAGVFFGTHTHYKLTEGGTILVRLEGEMENLPLFEQLAVIHEVEFFKDWIPFCFTSRTVEKLGPAELIAWVAVHPNIINIIV